MALAIRLLAALKTTALFAVRRPKEAAIILLVALLALTFWRLKRERGHAQELAAKLEGLPPDTKQIVQVARDRITVKWRDGPVRVEYRYLPPEGRIDVVSKIGDPNRSPEVVVKDRGFTGRLGGGVVYAGKLLPLVDWKLGFWRRYSITAGITPQFGGLGISRHIDDFMPFGNLEVIGLAGPNWTGKPQLGIGLRTNF